MDFVINANELNALCGLSHLQQLTYMRGIKPYMDLKTGIVGIKRKISLQSIAEQLYIEPHQGIQSGSVSRAQVRRALAGLERVGVIENQSVEMQLILKCPLATLPYSAQNKAVTNPSQEAVTAIQSQLAEFKALLDGGNEKATIAEPSKADTPHINNNIYIYLLSQFEQFWSAYPEKKSRNQAWAIFQQLQPDESLFKTLMQALHTQITHREAAIVAGQWLPPWKYPSTWLAKRCWEDELTTETRQEKKHATRRTVTRHEQTQEWFWVPDDNETDDTRNNVYSFEQYKSCQ